jgi:hypothetical protein
MTDRRAVESHSAVAGQVERSVRPLLVLTGKSAKGRNRLREAAAAMPSWDGSWGVEYEVERVPFAPGVPGPWLFVSPHGADSVDRERFSRWVHEYADENFDVAALVASPCEHRWKVTHSGVTWHDCRCELCGETKRETWD